MKLSVTVKPNAKEEKVTPQDDGTFAVSVKAPSREGKANERLVKLIAAHVGVAPSRVRIVSGAASRRKIVDIL